MSCCTQELRHYLTYLSSTYEPPGRGGGLGVGRWANWQDDLPLIIGGCQSLHNTENSAPSHAEHPRSPSSWLSTHGSNCAHCGESARRGVAKFIPRVQGNGPLGSDPTTSRCSRTTSVPELCVSSGFSCRVHFTRDRRCGGGDVTFLKERILIFSLSLYMHIGLFLNQTKRKVSTACGNSSDRTCCFICPSEIGVKQRELIATYLRRFWALSSR